MLPSNMRRFVEAGEHRSRFLPAFIQCYQGSTETSPSHRPRDRRTTSFLIPRCEIAKGSPDRRRDLMHVIGVAVWVARPGKVAAEETIVMATRHDVEMKVRHTLADHIVDRHE